MKSEQTEERIAEPIPEIYKELYRMKLVEGLETLAKSMDEILGVDTEDEIDRKRENLMLAIEASYLAIEASLNTAKNHIYRKKLEMKTNYLKNFRSG